MHSADSEFADELPGLVHRHRHDFGPEPVYSSPEYDRWDDEADQEFDNPTTGPLQVDAADISPVVSVTGALTGKAPILLVSRPHANSQQVPALLRVLASRYRKDVHLGAIAPLNRVSAAERSRFLDSCQAAALKVADPVGYLYADTVPGKTRPTSKGFLYQEKDTLHSVEPDDPRWCEQVVNAQRSAGANLIVSPGRWMPADAPEAELEVASDSLLNTIKVVNGQMPVVMNLTVSSRWLTDNNCLDVLVERINELAVPMVMLRAMWDPVETAAQPADRRLLEGYREISQTARAEGWTLLLPDSDLTGAVATAWGAAGFGTGVTSGNRAFVLSAGGGGGGGAAPRERYLEPQLLHTILRQEHQQLVRLGEARSCDCPYCGAAGAGGSWVGELQAGHHVCAVAATTARIRRNLKSGRRLVTDATEFARRIESKVALDPNSRPKHLALWRDLL
ncbi:hypothetical protein ABQF35_11115 [Mycobacterium syngnathidarum]